MEREPKKKEGEGGGEGRTLPHPLLALLLQHFSHGLVTLAPRSLLRNRTETLAMQATYL